MGQKRKRPVKNRTSPSQVFPDSHADSQHYEDTTCYSHPVISLYYPYIVTLRNYLLLHLPESSKLRRRHIRSLGSASQSAVEGGSEVDQLTDLLDTTLVGIHSDTTTVANNSLSRDFVAFTRSQDRSQRTDTGPPCSQSEIVDFVISSLFNRSAFSYQTPRHLLARGFRRAAGCDHPRNGALPTNIPGVVEQYPNENVRSLKRPPWSEVLGLLGDSGEEIMVRLLSDCGIFICINPKRRVYYQISGVPLTTLNQLNQSAGRQNNENFKIQNPVSVLRDPEPVTSKYSRNEILHKPNSIIFIRRRMLYARPALNAKGGVQFGLKHIHVLNRFPSSASRSQTVHVMKYIFPRQFRLHNVFTRATDGQQTAGRFRDYTMREDEIAQSEGKSANSKLEKASGAVPKRLRGEAVSLVQKLQDRNKRCPYVELLRYYCPTEPLGPQKFDCPPVPQPDSILDNGLKLSTSESLVTQPVIPMRQPPSGNLNVSALDCRSVDPDILPNKPVPAASIWRGSLTDSATSTSSVSAFCRAVMGRLIPPQFYGIGEGGASNKRIMLKNVDKFIRLRRFESLSLHDVCQGLKITCIPWLENTNARDKSPLSACKLSLHDLQKRSELLHEFIYYIFDSVLIPLIRTNFYVTESQVHRNRLFYFRHDVWLRLTEQPLHELTSTMLQEVEQSKAQRTLTQRPLGPSSLRLLPKATGVRPIFNLGRRPLLKASWTKGKTGNFVGSSINSTLAPVYNMLSYERSRKPLSLGAALQSVSEIHIRLRDFKKHLQRQQTERPLKLREPLYFVKLDIQSCFDTIPQHKLVRLIERLVSEEAYYISKHVEIKQSDEFDRFWQVNGRSVRTVRKFVGRAVPISRSSHLLYDIVTNAANKKRDTIFVDTLEQKEYNAEDLLDLLDEHIRNNIVRIGKRYFRQRQGIPQGSVLSSILCNFFYAELEREVLGFLQVEDALLLRLVDDFLLITPDINLASRFLQIMLKGHPAYGVSVNPAKSLVNFTISVDNTQVPRLTGSTLFPYCGVTIDMRTLEIYRDQGRAPEGGDSAAASISDSLTVELARCPGHSLHHKALLSLALQIQPMYLDTRLNSMATILLNLYTSFATTAMKMYQYMKCLQGQSHPPPRVVIRTIRDTIKLAYSLCHAKQDTNSASNADAKGYPPSTCLVQRLQVQYLGAAAFQFVLSRKQTRYTEVLCWLELVLKAARPSSDKISLRLTQVVRRGNAIFSGWRF